MSGRLFFSPVLASCNSIVVYLQFFSGALAQPVEQRTENPCVPSSILGGATNKNKGLRQIVNPFLLSEIDYKVTTKRHFWGVFGVIYYNPYYNFRRP